MLLRHSASYLLARGIPGLLNFAALAIYTHLLTPDEFGRYALVVAGATFMELVLFQWLYLAVGRFYSARQMVGFDRDPVLLIYVALGIILLSVAFGAVWVASYHWTTVIAAAVAMIISQAFLELNLAVASAQLAPIRFGLLLGTKNTIALIVGTTLAWFDFGEIAPVIGVTVGSIIASAAFGMNHWQSTRIKRPNISAVRDYFLYGFPLILSAAFYWITANSDRVLIAWLIGESAAGVYSAAYNLTQQSLGLALATVHRATYFIALHRLETEGMNSAQQQIKLNGELTICVALSGCIGLSTLSSSFVEVFVGVDFQTGALNVMPWIAVSAAIWGIKTDYLDTSFHLARQTNKLIAIGLVSAITNVTLNLVLIQWVGPIGAGYAAIGAAAVAALMSYHLGQRVFPTPPLTPILFRASLVSLLVFISTITPTFALPVGALTLILGLISGSVAALSGFIIMDIGGARREMKLLLNKNKGNS